MHMNTNPKRGWMQEEDELLLEMVAVAHSQKLKWVEVAKVLHQKLGRQRTGKQCRQRWQHQLNPSIVRDQWTENEQLRLFQLQSEYGNKWALIAQHLPGRTDNAVKNFFYSAIRKVFTKVNTYLVKHRNCKQFKSIRQFEADFLSKLMAVVDGNYSKKIRLTNNDAVLLAKKILSNVTVLSINHDDSQPAEQHFNNMITIMHDFRKSCKKRKQCKSQPQRGSVEIDEQELSSKQITSENNSRNSKNNINQLKPQQISEGQQEMKDQNDQAECNILQQLKNCLNKNNSSQEINTSASIQSNEFQPRLFKINTMIEEKRVDQWWEILEANSRANPFKIEEEPMGEWEWRSDEIFPLVYQREDFLNSSQQFGSNQIVTKFKMLEASIALEELRLNTKISSRLEQYQQQPLGLGLGI